MKGKINHFWLYEIGMWMIILLIPMVILLTTMQMFTFNKNFYLNEFKKYDISSITGMEMNDLERVTVKLIDYLKDKEKDLDMQAQIKGENQEVFGEREKRHMVDVKMLFQAGSWLRNTGAVLVIISLLIIRQYSNQFLKDILRIMLRSGVLSISIMMILFILVQTDFYQYFTYFHEIFFDNDLWLLDPNTEVLIQMLPLEFFIDISIRIFGWFSGIMLLITMISYSAVKKA
ncbi:MAG: TIGR01906 family membrane protein [Bacillota bacterium]